MSERAPVRALTVTPSPAGTAAGTRLPSPATPAQASTAPARERAGPGGGALLAFFGLLVAINLAGLPYYILSKGARVRSPLHIWLKPTGYVGQAAGFLAFALFLYLWLYPLRKKFTWLEFTGPISRWLDLHVAAGLFIPLLAAIHAAWHFTGLIGLGYGAMLVAWGSGLVGRYLYARIPRSRGGLTLTMDEINAQSRALLQRIGQVTGLDPAAIESLLRVDPLPYSGLGPLATLRRMAADDIRRWKVGRALRRRWRATARGRATADRAPLAEVLRLARRQMALTQQIRMLDATNQLFRYWHVAHKPFALSALFAVALHVVAAVALGVTWVRW